MKKIFLILLLMTNITHAANRTFNFINRCPFPVWFGFISGATASRTGKACTSDIDCHPGSVCVNRGGGNTQCFWKNPAPANGQYKLAANGGKNSVAIPIYSDLKTVWSGAIAGRTNCTQTGCRTADCGGGEGACLPGRGFMQPATQAEMTLGVNDVDFYDVEVINGFNVPIEMSPNLSNAPGTNKSCNTPYFCGNPGAPIPLTQVGRCSWHMTPPSNDYRWVMPGGSTCIVDTDCLAPFQCGLSFNPGQSPLLKKTCGKLLGYWTANQVCGIVPNYGSPFNCRTPLPPPQQNLTVTNLYGCTQVGSCYQSGASEGCCGCANWDKVGANVPPNPFTEQCVNSNPSWVNYVQPTLLWLKKSCPTLYTYPYDDMSSTFICRSQTTGENMVGYTITFCPSQLTGGVGHS